MFQHLFSDEYESEQPVVVQPSSTWRLTLSTKSESMIYDIVRYHDIYPNVPREKEGLLCCIR